MFSELGMFDNCFQKQCFVFQKKKKKKKEHEDIFGNKSIKNCFLILKTKHIMFSKNLLNALFFLGSCNKQLHKYKKLFNVNYYM